MTSQQTDALERYLHDAAQRHADELFLIPGEPVSYRVRGSIERDEGDVLTAEEVESIAAAAVGDEGLAKIGTQTGELTAPYHIPGVLNAQVCVAKACGVYTVAARVLPTALFDVDAIGLPQAVIDACDARNGLVIVGGPVGSGKTTTAYVIVDDINRRKPVHICTVEDPVAVRLTPKKALIQQRSVGVDAPSCIAAIRAAMRQNFDVLFVAEMRTPEEVQACVTAAETFALVITQVHARSPQAAIQRLIDVQPDATRDAFRRALADALRVVLVQCLPRKADGKGRVAAYGVLIPDDDVRSAIVEGRDPFDRATPLPEGCQTLAQHFQQLVRDGIVTEEAARESLGRT